MRKSRPLVIILEFIAIGAGAFLLGGTAYADASNPATNTTSTVTVVTETQSSTAVGDSVSTNSEVAPLESQPAQIELETANSLSLDLSQSAAQTIGPSIVDVSLENLTITPVLSESVVATDTSNTVDAGSSNPVPPAPMTKRSNLASAVYSELSTSFSKSATDFNDSVLSYTVPVNNTTKNIPDPSPTVPFGIVSAILSLFSEAVPGVFTNLVDPIFEGSVGLLIALTMVALAVVVTARTTVVSYGTWLKLTGYSCVSRSGLPAPYSIFATPRLMGYVSAPAPYA